MGLSEPSSSSNLGQGNSPTMLIKSDIDFYSLQTQGSNFLWERNRFVGGVCDPGGHPVQPDVALVISTSQHLKASQTSDVHKEFLCLPPGELQESLHLHTLLLLAVGEVCPEDNDLAVVGTLGGHQLVSKAADRVNVGMLLRNSGQSRMNLTTVTKILRNSMSYFNSTILGLIFGNLTSFTLLEDILHPIKPSSVPTMIQPVPLSPAQAMV